MILNESAISAKNLGHMARLLPNIFENSRVARVWQVRSVVT